MTARATLPKPTKIAGADAGLSALHLPFKLPVLHIDGRVAQYFDRIHYTP